MKRTRAVVLSILLGAWSVVLADSARQAPTLPQLEMAPVVTMPEGLVGRWDVAVRTLQSQVKPMPPSQYLLRCGCHWAAVELPELLDQSGYIKMLAEALKGSSSVDIFYGERRGKVYSSDDNTAICDVFGFLARVVAPKGEAYVELADEPFDSNSYIKQTNLIPTCIFVFDGEKPTSVQIDLEKRSLIISAEKTWGVFRLEEATCGWIEAFVRARVLGAVKAAQVARR